MRTCSHFVQGDTLNDGRQVNAIYVIKNYQMFGFSRFDRNVFLSPESLKQVEIGFALSTIVGESTTAIDG